VTWWYHEELLQSRCLPLPSECGGNLGFGYLTFGELRVGFLVFSLKVADS
jgi:hypothetical protein